MSNNNEYMRRFMKAWYDRRHREAMVQLGGRCTACGLTDGLQFDHIDPSTKTMTIAKMWTASEVRFQTELAKCQLLCIPCHQKKTLDELGFKVAKGTHGTLSAARYCGPPKCEDCRRARREYMREWKTKPR